MASFSLDEARVCVVGATSSVARATAEHLAVRGATLHLAARDEEEAVRIGRDLWVRHGASVTSSRFEATDLACHGDLLDAASSAMGGLDALLVAVGMLGDQARAEDDPAHLREIVEVNFTAVVQLLTRAAERFEEQEHGMIVALSSVAGDRGRPSNYAYGSAKAGLTAFLSGLRGRLRASGVHVLTVKPGPVDTKMTFGMENSPPLMAEPERVARDVIRAMLRRQDVCYTPAVWRGLMAVVRALPEAVFKRLSL